MVIQVQRPPPASPLPRQQASTAMLAATDVALTLVLVMAMLRIAVEPDWAHLDGKAPVARAVLFPLWALGLPAFWMLTRRAAPFPWAADLLVTLTCLLDVLGNRLDLYDSLPRFDDGVHLLNSATVAVVYVLLAVPPQSSPTAVADAAVAAGLTASLAWELFEYAAFLARTTEWTTVYSDTIGDLSLGLLGSLLAAAVMTTLRRSDRARQARQRGRAPGARESRTSASDKDHQPPA